MRAINLISSYSRKSNPAVRKYVTEKYGSDFKKLESEFVEKLLEIIKSYPTGNGYIGKYKYRSIEKWRRAFHYWLPLFSNKCSFIIILQFGKRCSIITTRSNLTQLSRSGKVEKLSTDLNWLR